MSKAVLAFIILQYIIGIGLLFMVQSDIQLLPAVMILLNATNFMVLYKSNKKGS